MKHSSQPLGMFFYTIMGTSCYELPGSIGLFWGFVLIFLLSGLACLVLSHVPVCSRDILSFQS